MPARPLQTATRSRAGVALVELAGDIDGSAEATLGAAWDEATRDAPARVVLDFAQVEYINSTGIALIVGLLARARAARVEIAACGLVDHYREIFEITRLSDFMQIFPDERAALAETQPGTTEEVSG